MFSLFFYLSRPCTPCTIKILPKRKIAETGNALSLPSPASLVKYNFMGGLSHPASEIYFIRQLYAAGVSLPKMAFSFQYLSLCNLFVFVPNITLSISHFVHYEVLFRLHHFCVTCSMFNVPCSLFFVRLSIFYVQRYLFPVFPISRFVLYRTIAIRLTFSSFCTY